MVYYFTDFEKITLDICNELFESLPLFKKNNISRRPEQLCAFRLLCFAIGFVPNKFLYNEYGKPYLSECDIHFNITHTNQFAAVAVSDSPIGIDAEKIREYPKSILIKAFTSDEIFQINNSSNANAAFFKLWTLKESYIKYIGKGLSFPLKNIEFNLNGEKIICSDSSLIFSVHTIENYCLSICGHKKLAIKPVSFENLLKLV